MQAETLQLQKHHSAEAAEATARLQQLASKCNKQAEVTSTMKQQLKELQQRLAAREAAVEELQGQVERKEEAVGKLQRQIADMDGLLQVRSPLCLGAQPSKCAWWAGECLLTVWLPP
jgi:hypothetical protein